MKITRTTQVALGAVGVLVALAAAPLTARAATLDAPLTQTLAAPQKTGVSAVIARTSGPLTLAQQKTLTALGADITRHLSLIHSVALTVPRRNLSRLAALPFVTRLSYDGQIKKCDAFIVTRTGADVAAKTFAVTGKGITVAVLDSGIVGHHDLDVAGPATRPSTTPTRILWNQVFDPNADQDDDCGHGTHVAGIIAGNGNDSTQGYSAPGTGSGFTQKIAGIAPQANLVNVRVLGKQGQGTVSQVISGLQWTVANKAKYNIRVINLSLGHPVGESYTTDPLCQAVEAAYRAGIVVVCAAGNNGRASTTQTAGVANEGWGTNYGSIASPGNDPYVITVGAMKNMDGVRADDCVSTYSSRGPSRLDLIMKPDIIAPGNKVVALNTIDDNQGCYLGQYESTNGMPWKAYESAPPALMGPNSTTYYVLSGTSMAAPVVSGAVALMLQKNPALTPDMVKARLMFSADKWADPSGNADPCTYGAGYLNIPAALTSTVVTTQPVMSPSMSFDSAGNVYINMDRAIWGTHAIWGTGLTDLHAIWGTRAIWGTSTLSSSHAIWGTSVWSDRATWGTSTSAVDLSGNAIRGE